MKGVVLQKPQYDSYNITIIRPDLCLVVIVLYYKLFIKYYDTILMLFVPKIAVQSDSIVRLGIFCSILTPNAIYAHYWELGLPPISDRSSSMDSHHSDDYPFHKSTFLIIIVCLRYCPRFCIVGSWGFE